METVFSVIVCTYNGSERIIRTLDALVDQDFSKDHFEMIIVDNNSSDHTSEVIQRYMKNYPHQRIRYCFEEEQGQSFARNKGIKEAIGEILAFTDDDGLPERNWLSELLKIYQKEKKVGCVGGRVILDLPPDLPNWYNEELGRFYLAGFDLKVNQPMEVDHVYSFPFGVNISFLKEAILEVGLFDSNLGKVGKKTLTGDETDRCLALYQKNWRIFYHPTAIVHHVISPERISKPYFKKMAVVSGILRVIWDRRMKNIRGMFLARMNYLKSALHFFLLFLILKIFQRANSFNKYLMFQSAFTSFFYSVRPGPGKPISE